MLPVDLHSLRVSVLVSVVLAPIALALYTTPIILPGPLLILDLSIATGLQYAETFDHETTGARSRLLAMGGPFPGSTIG